MEFSHELLLITALIFFFATFIHGSIGFGFPLVATPLLTLVSDIHTAIILTLIPTLLVNLVSIGSEGSIALAVRRYLGLALLAMIGSAIGTYILIFTESRIFELLLALSILFYLLADKANLHLAWIPRHPRFSKVLFGVSAGILGGLTNVMGPILIIYGLESKFSRAEIIQAFNFCFLLGKIVQLVLFASYGVFGASELSLSLLMIIVVVLALSVGIAVRKRIDAQSYTKYLRIFLLVLAVMLLGKFVV